MADEKLSLPKEQAKRTNYFTSQFLVEGDFRNEQAYQLEMRRLHNRALHIWGVVDGLLIKREGPLEVSVSAGMAIDKDGKEIILPQSTAQPPKLKFDKSPSGSRALFVVISYKDDDQNPEYIYSGRGLTDKKYTRIVEGWELEVTENAPDDGSKIKLARLTLNENGLVGDPDNTVRRLAGSYVPRGSWLGAQDLYIEAGGKIGIGTTRPAVPLAVAANGTTLGMLKLANTHNTGGDRWWLGFNHGDDSTDNNDRARIGVDIKPNGAGRLFFSTGTAGGQQERMRIDESGNVGIGIVEPGQKLQVAGALKLSTNPTVSNDQAAAYFWNQANVGPTIAGGHFEVRTGGDTPRLRITSGGNVGIGTTDPGKSKLKISNATDDFLDVRFLEAITGMGQLEIVGWASGWNINAKTNGKHLHLNRDAGVDSNVLVGRPGKELFVKGSDGKVGIGTLTPGFPLSFTDTAGDKIALWGQSGSHFGFGIQNGLLQIHTDGVGSDIVFGYGASGSFTETMRIKGSGNVGIGTPTPNSSLVIRKDASKALGPVLTLFNGSGGENAGAAIDFHTYETGSQAASARLFAVDDGHASNHLVFYTKDPGKNENSLTERLRLTSDGNVGLGTNTPGSHINLGNYLKADKSGRILELYSPDHESLVILSSNQDSNAAHLGGLYFTRTAAQTDAHREVAAIKCRQAGTGDLAGGSLQFFTKVKGGGVGFDNPRMVILDGGSVGIGTTKPEGAALVVMGSDSYGVKIGAVGAMNSKNSYSGDAIKGIGNLWLDADVQVIIKPGWKTAATDLAEIFETAEQIAPGDVVVFDERENAAKLCEREGDSCVIGITSTEPAGILGKLDASAPPIALCGRVPCNVDADIAPIRTGDLLTTSPTRGHAQKVLDISQSAGAIIGKALGSLEKGKGQITVLVALA